MTIKKLLHYLYSIFVLRLKKKKLTMTSPVNNCDKPNIKLNNSSVKKKTLIKILLNKYYLKVLSSVLNINKNFSQILIILLNYPTMNIRLT